MGSGRLVRSLALGTGGLVLVGGGYVADSLAHTTDAHLAEHEGPLSLSNPAHVCVFLGLVAVAIGLGLGWIEALAPGSRAPVPLRSGRRAVVVSLAASVLLSAGLGGFAVAEAQRSAAAASDPATCAAVHAGGHDVGPIPPGARLPTTAQAALDALSDGGLQSVTLGADAGFGHHAGPAGAAAVLPADLQALLDEQIACARAAAEQLATPELAAAAGYVQGSTRTVGIGVHWIDWTEVGQPFDPARPAMLLFDQRRPSGPLELVGFSYWAGSDGAPAGFAGTDDHWHQHVGMCFQDGWLAQQSVATAADCAGDFVAGTNLWMLHAWVVEDVPNRWGLFADLNPSLCTTPRNTPDFLRCEPDRL